MRPVQKRRQADIKGGYVLLTMLHMQGAPEAPCSPSVVSLNLSVA